MDTENKLKTYKAFCTCDNCKQWGTVEIPYGKTVRDFSKEKGCPYCGTDNLKAI